MLNRKNLIAKLAIFLILTFLFWLRGVIFIDPDMWWHFKMGEIILTQSFPKTDPFSYSMPSYSYSDHEWLTEIFMFKTAAVIGILGLALIFALITSLSIFIIMPKTLPFQLPFFFFAGSTLLGYTGIRPQVISWFFFAFLLTLLKKKAFIFLPPLFLFWANIHAGFLAGLILIFLFFLSKSIFERKVSFKSLLLFLSCLFITLINPYEVKLWQEIWSITSDVNIKLAIMEWLPLLSQSSNLLQVLYLVFTTLLTVKFIKKMDLFQNLSFLTFSLMALISCRNFPFFLIISLPIINSHLILFINQLKKEKALFAFKKVRIAVLLFFIALSFVTIANTFSLSTNPPISYPYKAIAYVKKNNPAGNIFAPYGWGGYLSWGIPQKKVFIDGRMPNWKQVGKAGESSNAFKEYLDIISSQTTNKDLTKFLNKYSISLVFWDKTYAKNPQLLKKLEELGWRNIYSDKVSVIYQK